MVSRGAVSDDVSYVLLETPLVPRLNLSDCRPTELPVLPETTPPVAHPDHAPLANGCGGGKGGSAGQKQGGGGQTAAGGDSDRVPVLPRAVVTGTTSTKPAFHHQQQHLHQRQQQQKPPPKPVITDVRSVVVDMRDIGKLTGNSSSRTNDDGDDDNISGEPIVADEPVPARKRSGGVLKGGGDYVSSGEQRPRPRVSFLLDATPVQGQGGETVQIRVYSKPPQTPSSNTEEGSHRLNNTQDIPNGVLSHRIRTHGSAESRQAVNSYKQQIREMQAEARLREAYAAASRAAEGGYKMRRGLHDDHYSQTISNTYTPQLPIVSHGHGHAHSHAHASRRNPLFSFKRHSATDVTYGSAHQHHNTSTSASATIPATTNNNNNKEWRNKKSFMLPSNGHGSRPTKGQVRFQEEEHGMGGGEGGADRLMGDGNVGSSEYANLYAKHVEHRPGTTGGGGGTGQKVVAGLVGTYTVDHKHNVHSSQQRVLGTYNVSDHPPRAASCKPPIPSRPSHGQYHHEGAPGSAGSGPRITSANTRSGSRVREWLSVDTVPPGGYHKHRTRPSTVSSASSSTRSRDLSSAKQRMGLGGGSAGDRNGGSSRVSSASIKAASDPGVDLENMDLVTLNLIARRAKGPSRYRYLAKLRSLNLNTPRPLA